MGSPKHQLFSKSETLQKIRFFWVGWSRQRQFWPFLGSLGRSPARTRGATGESVIYVLIPWYGLSKTPTIFQIGDTSKNSIFLGGVVPAKAILAFFRVFGSLSCSNQRGYGGKRHLCFDPLVWALQNTNYLPNRRHFKKFDFFGWGGPGKGNFGLF